MIAEALPVQRRPDAKLLFADQMGGIKHLLRSDLLTLLRPRDVLVANDAATLPASLMGIHCRTGRQIEVRLASRPTLDLRQVSRFSAIVFGEGDFRLRTEDRPDPPILHPGDELGLATLKARVSGILNHPRLVALEFQGTADEIWDGISAHGRPIQYSHIQVPLALCDTWTPIAGPPVAFEPPSAGFALSWRFLDLAAAKGVRVCSVTHAAGISSTGDPALDRLLPFDEPYYIPHSTGNAIQNARAEGGRVIAVGTTVARALEHSAAADGVVHAGEGLATQKIGPASRLRAVDAILSGTHEQDTSHFELLKAFAADSTLQRACRELDHFGYRTHEFGDSVFIEKAGRPGIEGPPTTQIAVSRSLSGSKAALHP
jgi:S-adenosylmethionine:tRNA ribosyltransferase-isomerase